eukprot:m.89307 g.89307  ORF g.89307 m.89307 type:complete len:250 (+) comp8406_c0_seq2:342-1091(+)
MAHAPHRLHQYKAHGRSWREQLKEKCLERIKRARADVFNSARSLDRGLIASAVREQLHVLGLQPPDDDDIDDLVSLQNEIAEELAQQALAALEGAEQAEIEATLASQDAVICPVCMRHALARHRSVIACRCGFALDTHTDAISLDYVRHRLEATVATHSQVCGATLTFAPLQNMALPMATDDESVPRSPMPSPMVAADGAFAFAAPPPALPAAFAAPPPAAAGPDPAALVLVQSLVAQCSLCGFFEFVI